MTTIFSDKQETWPEIGQICDVFDYEWESDFAFVVEDGRPYFVKEDEQMIVPLASHISSEDHVSWKLAENQA